MGPYKHNVPVWYLSHNTPEWHKNLRNQDNHGTKYMGSPVGETDGQSRSVTEWYWEDDLPHWTFIYSPTRWIQFLIYRIHEVDSSIEVCIRPLKPSISWGLKKFKWINCHRLWFDFLETRAKYRYFLTQFLVFLLPMPSRVIVSPKRELLFPILIKQS